MSNRRRLDRGLCMALSGFLLAVTAGDARAATLDALVALVGSRVIMLSDVRLARDLGRPAALSDDETLRFLINRGLMLAEVARFQQPDPPAIAIETA
ncbi:MAG: hypothetical protein IT304_12980, partial [Dehalococcoidia bacterium]|nr:hypothetical protein [Dehalococcoidia bacterium]